MNTFFREDIPDSVGDTFLIETNRPYQILLCGGATSVKCFLWSHLRLPAHGQSRWIAVFKVSPSQFVIHVSWGSILVMEDSNYH